MEIHDPASILAHFSIIKDPRRNDWNTLHRLEDILTMALAAVIGGADGWDEIALFAKTKADWFQERLHLEHGVPSSDTFRRVIASINPACFAECLASWIASAVGRLGGDLVAIDGKTLRGSYEKDDPKAAIHMVSAWASANRMILAQYKVEDKSNEITAIPKLLSLLDLEGCLVTMDAMGCQREIARQLTDEKADYLLALKGNQPTLHADVKAFFADAEAHAFEAMDVSQYETEHIAHGRKERRRCIVSEDVSWLTQYEKWAGLRTIACVSYCRDVYSDAAFEQRYYLSSRAMSAATLMEAVQQHWEIENRVHWVLDVSFSEDASRIRRNDGAENFSVIRRLALNVIRHDETSKTKSIKGRRRQAGWSNDYLAQLLRL